jgi:hypothetical protein
MDQINIQFTLFSAFLFPVDINDDGGVFKGRGPRV